MGDGGTDKDMVLMNKRGFIFTTIMIVMLLLFLITFSFYSDVKERKSIQTRIETMNSFVSSLESNLPRQLKTSGFRIIFLLEKRIVEKGSYITNLNGVFSEAFFNGTLYSEINPDVSTIMDGAKFNDIKELMQENADKINIHLEFYDPWINISQADPWNMQILFSFNLVVKDTANLASWNRTENMSVMVPIEHFEDPMYIINTNGLVVNKIKMSPYSGFVAGSDISNLSIHSENSYYIASNSAPSFLNRLEGRNIPNTNGIESLVNLGELSGGGISTSDKSVVDYIYFSSSDPAACNVNPSGMPSWFKLDNLHLAKYEVSC